MPEKIGKKIRKMDSTKVEVIKVVEEVGEEEEVEAVGRRTTTPIPVE